MPYRNFEEPDEPDEPGEPEEPAGETPTLTTPVVTTGSGGREYEYRLELLTVEQVADGKTLAERLTAASADGWDLVEVVDAGAQRAVLLRKPKRREHDRRPVGFSPQSRA